MANQILIKHTATPGKVPAATDLALGELAVNTNDGKLFFKKNLSGVDSILTIDPATINTVSSVNGNTGAVVVSPASIGAINTNQIGVASGVPSLDSAGRVPRAQLPEIQLSLTAAKQVDAMSGTTLIPYDNTTPTITEGTEIANQGYTPSDPGSKMKIEGCINVDCSTANRNFILTFFRDSTCIGVVTKNFATSGRPDIIPFTITDLNMGASFGSNVTYSVRIGINSNATWYVNRLATQLFNGLMINNSVVFSEFL